MFVCVGRFVAGKPRAAYRQLPLQPDSLGEGPQSVSGAVHPWVARVQRLLVGGSGRRPFVCFAAISDTIEEVDGETWEGEERGS